MTVVVEKPQGGKVTWTLSIEEAQAIEVLLGSILIGDSKTILGRDMVHSAAYVQLMSALEREGLRIDRKMGQWRLALETDEPAEPEFELSNQELLAIRAILGASHLGSIAERLHDVTTEDLWNASNTIHGEVERRGLKYPLQPGSLV